MFGCICRLNNIYFDERVKLWRAKLTLCAVNDEDLKDFASILNSQVGDKDKLLSLGTYLFQMHKYDQAENHYQIFLQNNQIDYPIQLAYCHHGLAQVKKVKDEYNLATENLEKAIDYIVKTNENRDHPLLSECYNNLGTIYTEQENYPLATHFYDEAFRITPSVTLSNMAQMHFKLKNYKLALKYLQEVLDNQSEEEHSPIANTYRQMGEAYAAMNDKNKALEMFNKAIKSQLKVVDREHPDLGNTYNALVSIYLNINDEEKAFEYINKAS